MDIRETLFRYRSYTPIPFLILMIIFAKPNAMSFAVGFVFLIIGEFIRLWGVSLAGGETRTTKNVGGSQLVTSGPFSYVRNPLYLGNITMYFGIGVMSNAAFPVLTIITLFYFFMQYHFIVKLEEEHLEKMYGDEYRNYKSLVPRFIPKFRKYKFTKSEQPKLEWKKGLKSEIRTFQAIILVILIIIVIWILRSESNTELVETIVFEAISCI